MLESKCRYFSPLLFPFILSSFSKLFWGFRGSLSSAHSLLLALYSEVTPGWCLEGHMPYCIWNWTVNHMQYKNLIHSTISPRVSVQFLIASISLHPVSLFININHIFFSSLNLVQQLPWSTCLFNFIIWVMWNRYKLILIFLKLLCQVFLMFGLPWYLWVYLRCCWWCVVETLSYIKFLWRILVFLF